LDRAARAGLPVPEGCLVEEGLDPAAAAAALARAFSDGVSRLAVRSAFAGEDGETSSQAGAFHSELGVDPSDTASLEQSIRRVRASADGRAVGRVDVLVQRLVAASRAGVAFTEADHEDDLVESVAGLADGLLSGRELGEVWDLPKLRVEDLWGGPRASDPIQRRLQCLLRRVRSLFGHRDLDVEWADDGRHIYLVQVRPVTRAPLRDEWFTVANHREILPELPSVAMTSVLSLAAGELYDWYRRHDRALPARRLFLEVFAGRPRINLGLLTDTVRILGLPTRLVTDSIGGGNGDGPIAQPLRFGRLLRRVPTLFALWRSQRSAVLAARRAERRFEEILRSLGDSPDLAAIGAALAAIYVELVHAMIGLTAAMSGPLALLRRLGTLEAHSATHRTVTTRVWEELDRVRDTMDAEDRAACAVGKAPCSPTGGSAFTQWLERFGHRGVFESDVARPRFAEDPAAVIRALASPAGPRRQRPRRSALAACTAPLWWAARGPLDAREELRDRAMVAFGALRSAARARASHHAAAGRIPHPGFIWELGLGEWRALEDGETFAGSHAAERRAERERLAVIRLRDVFRRRSPEQPSSAPASGSSLRGLGLTRGGFVGPAVVLSGPDEVLPSGVDPAQAVVIAPAIDVGWVPLLTTVGALVVEIGGELSHGSILVREVGLPAVTNVAGAQSAFRTGDVVRLDGSTGQVELVRRSDEAGTAQR
jgi:phosphohistidine swiveling domain-containing protein